MRGPFVCREPLGLDYAGPRGAVGGCNTPGSRVDPWWSPGPFFPPAPARVDEGPRSNPSLNSINYGSPAPTTTQNSSAPSYSQSTSSSCSHHSGIITSGCVTSRNAVSLLDGGGSTSSFDRIHRNEGDARDSSAVNSSPYQLASQNNVLSALLASTSTASSNPHQQSLRNAITTTESNILCSLLASSGGQEFAGSNVAEATSPDSLHNILSSLNVRIKSEEAPDCAISSPKTAESCGTVRDFSASLLGSLLSTSRVATSTAGTRTPTSSAAGVKSEYSTTPSSAITAHANEKTCTEASAPVKIEYALSATSVCCDVLDDSEDNLAATSPYNVISTSDNRHANRGPRTSSGAGPPLQTAGVLSKEDFRRILQSTTTTRCEDTSTSASELIADMKYETQTAGQSALNGPNSGVEQSHHPGQGNSIVVAGSPAEVVGVDSLLLSPWGATGTDFLESSDAKQSAGGLQDALDSYLLGSSVGVTSQSLAELKPLPPFTGYTGHLSINGIPGHHYHAIATQRAGLQSSSPTPSSNQEYYDPHVSSSTPCPQGNSNKQLPQSTQHEEYDIEDIAAIIGSAIADTTVPGGNNGSENDPNASRETWIDLDWIDVPCSPKTPQQQENNTSPSPFSQLYGNANAASQNQQHGSTLHSILTQQSYAPLLHARLQANNNNNNNNSNNNNNLQNPACGETPSSTSPYPPVSPPGRVSTSCSPDHLLHSSFAAPSHPRKRSRPPTGSQNPSKKNPSTTTSLPYGTESGLIGGKEKPVHRCSICNRGFLNKSNIKVHLRTHTGEKPFRCEVCGKAFRQKAHLIKHQQIHKRIGRD